jgi:hypothetical protein
VRSSAPFRASKNPRVCQRRRFEPDAVSNFRPVLSAWKTDRKWPQRVVGACRRSGVRLCAWACSHRTALTTISRAVRALWSEQQKSSSHCVGTKQSFPKSRFRPGRPAVGKQRSSAGFRLGLGLAVCQSTQEERDLPAPFSPYLCPEKPDRKCGHPASGSEPQYPLLRMPAEGKVDLEQVPAVKARRLATIDDRLDNARAEP